MFWLPKMSQKTAAIVNCGNGGVNLASDYEPRIFFESNKSQCFTDAYYYTLVLQKIGAIVVGPAFSEGFRRISCDRFIEFWRTHTIILYPLRYFSLVGC